MINKQFAVIGLGKFGMSVAKTLASSGCEVIAIDKNEELVDEIADDVSYAAKADITEPDVIKKIGISNVDVVVICMGSMETSILATILCKELGVSTVVSKATNEIYSKVLKKVGADITIIPEAEMGYRLSKNLISGMFRDMFEISKAFSMIEVLVPKSWIGCMIGDLKIREKYNINVVAVKNDQNVNASIMPDLIFKEGDCILIVGNNNDLEKFTGSQL